MDWGAKNVDEELRELLDKWYETIGVDHHKEKDCWFQICESYCAYRVGTCGGVKKTEYYFQHEGYLEKDTDWGGWDTFPTREEAVSNLKDFLRHIINRYEEDD